mmetsp:Transcript_30142/g.96202  ORF Transcript_30142/g.96202 Transcript_30142/m.96202 type:complete len:288 (+) Transcript_30142:1478-2341(+)
MCMGCSWAVPQSSGATSFSGLLEPSLWPISSVFRFHHASSSSSSSAWLSVVDKLPTLCAAFGDRAFPCFVCCCNSCCRSLALATAARRLQLPGADLMWSVAESSWSSEGCSSSTRGARCSQMLMMAPSICSTCPAKASFSVAAVAPRRRLQTARGLNCGKRVRLSRSKETRNCGLLIFTIETALTRLASAFAENSCRRPAQQAAAASKKDEQPGQHWAAAQITAESSCGLCWCNFTTETSRSEENKRDQELICSLAKAQRMFAMFCGTISCRFRIDAASTFVKSVGC